MRIPVLLCVLTLALAGCQGSGGGDGRPTVVAAFYPLAYAAEQIGGDAIDVIDLTPAGAEPHDLELSPQQVAQIAEADLVLYIPGFQPAVDEAVAQQAGDRAVDVTQGIDMIPGDPHVWLDPLNMTIIEVAALVRDNGVTTVYYERLVDPKVAETVASEAGAQTAVLDPIEGLPEGYDGDYATLMQDNLVQVRAGQGCP